MISIVGLDKGKVIAALYNASIPVGRGFIEAKFIPLTGEEAFISWDFDYLGGRLMKIRIENDQFNPYRYDQFHGTGAAEEVINILRNTGDVNAPSIQKLHKDRLLKYYENQKIKSGFIDVSEARRLIEGDSETCSF